MRPTSKIALAASIAMCAALATLHSAEAQKPPAKAQTPAPLKTAAKKKVSARVPIKIQVIEANIAPGKADPRLAELMKSMPGYKSARIVDELLRTVAVGSTVSLQYLKTDKTKIVKVEVLSANAEAVKLSLEAQFKTLAKTKTTHRKGRATVMFGKKIDAKRALFLAVTPTLPTK